MYWNGSEIDCNEEGRGGEGRGGDEMGWEGYISGVKEKASNKAPFIYSDQKSF